MDLDNLTLGQAKQIAQIFCAKNADKKDHGPAIVVLDRGFVYVGASVVTDENWCEIADSKNIRIWGTSNGLGELVLNGPTKTTKLDHCGMVRSSLRAVISIHPVSADVWKRF